MVGGIFAPRLCYLHLGCEFTRLRRAVAFWSGARRPSMGSVALCFSMAISFHCAFCEEMPLPEPAAIEIGESNLLQGETSADSEMEHQPNFDAAELIAPLESSNGAQPASRWKASPHFDGKVTYDDNIFIQPRNKEADVLFTASPGIGAGFWDAEERFESYLMRDKRASHIERPAGNFLIADYTATLIGFVEHRAENSFDHDAVFEGHWSNEKVTLSAQFHFQTGSGPDIDVGGRVRRRLSTASAGVRYGLDEKVYFETTGTHTASEPEGLVSSVEWKSESWINYLATPLITLAAGATLGRLDIENASSETYEQALLRVTYSATEKVAFTANGGCEFRQQAGESDEVTPVFGAGVSYTPAEGTVITAEGSRTVEHSEIDAGENYTLTSFSGRVRRFLSRGIYLTLEGGYRIAEYTGHGFGARRKDDYYFVQPGILYNATRFCNLQMLYVHQENASSLSDFSFTDNQAQFQLSLIY